MRRSSFLILCAALALSACATGGAISLGPDGRPLPQVYRITPEVSRQIPFRMLDSVNSLRAARGAGPLVLNAELNAAAATHARDMSVQNRPWHFGSDGSSLLDRVQRVGYRGRIMDELISESFETELETLSSWMGRADTREIILDPSANQMGLAWFQESSGKIWWTMITGAGI